MTTGVTAKSVAKFHIINYVLSMLYLACLCVMFYTFKKLSLVLICIIFSLDNYIYCMAIIMFLT